MFPSKTQILIIDESPSVLGVLKGSLNGLGLANVAQASNGSAAWLLLEKAASANLPTQLIVSELYLPDMKGIDLLKKVRASIAYKHTPFIFLTAESKKELVLEAIQAGANNFITKPFTPKTLEEKLNAVHDRLTKK